MLSRLCLPRARRTNVLPAPLVALGLLAAGLGSAAAPGVLGPVWSQVLATDPVYAVGTDPSGGLVLAGGLALHRSTDGGDSWGMVWDGGYVSALYSVASDHDGAFLYAGGINGVRFPLLLHSQDGGDTWDYGDIDDVSGDGWVTAIEPHPTVAGLAVAAVMYELSPGAVLLTTDGGKTWTTLATADNAQVADVAWWGEGEDRILVGTALGLGLVEGDQVEVFFTDAGEMRSIAVHPDGVLYTSSIKDWVWQSVGDYQSLEPWAELPGEPAEHVAVNPNDAAEVWATVWPGDLLRCTAGSCVETSPPSTVVGSHLSAAGAAFAAATDGVWRTWP